LVDFSETRELFVNIFGFRGLTEKIRNCGLILDKLRVLNEKWLEYLIPELFSNRKCDGHGPWLVDQRRGGRSTGPPWTPPHVRRQELAGAWPSGRSGPRRLTARVETGRAQCGMTGRPLTRARMTVRRQRTDNGASAAERARRGSGGEQERA
jgi:hypothetical protein